VNNTKCVSKFQKNILVTEDEDIYPNPSNRDPLADSNNYVIDGDESHAWVRLLFVDNALNFIKDKSLKLILTISKVRDASSRSGMIIYHGDIAVGRVGAVTQGEVVKASLDISKIIVSDGKLELTLRAAGTDAPYIMSKVSGQGAELEIGSDRDSKATDNTAQKEAEEKAKQEAEEKAKQAKAKAKQEAEEIKAFDASKDRAIEISDILTDQLNKFQSDNDLNIAQSTIDEYKKVVKTAKEEIDRATSTNEIDKILATLEEETEKFIDSAEDDKPTIDHKDSTILDTEGIDGIEDIDSDDTTTVDNEPDSDHRASDSSIGNSTEPPTQSSQSTKSSNRVTPIKIELTTTSESYGGSDGTITSNITLKFWNVGAKVSGYGHAELDIISVASNGKRQEHHYRGRFDGGRNGDMELSDGDRTVHISVIGGETVTFDGQGIRIKIPNPSVFD